jgi:hypothetical protein
MGRLHEDYMKEHNSDYYESLISKGQLYDYLTEVDNKAEERMEEVIEQFRIPKLNSEVGDSYWDRIMIKNMWILAEEVVLAEIIYA